MRSALLLFLVAGAAFAQAPDEKPKLAPEIAALLDAARGVEPEYHADILYRVLSSDRVSEQELRDELLEELFELGPRVKYPVRLRSTSAVSDSSSGQLSFALRSGLDGLTIQCRAVQQLLESNPQRARELFEHIPQPTIDPVTCTATTRPSTAIYYETLLAGHARWFTDEEREKGVHQRFLLDRLQRIRSPLAMAAASGLLLETDPTADEFEELYGAYAAAFGGLSMEIRETTASSLSLVGALTKIVGRARELGIPEQPLLEIVREYFVTRLTGPLCPLGDKSKWTWGLTLGALTKLVQLGTVGDAQMVERFTEEEMTPSEILDGPEFERLWTSPDEKALLEGARHLLFGGGKEYLSLETRQTPEWEYEAHQYLLQVESWDRPVDLSPVVYFTSKVANYSQLVSLIPPGTLHERALGSYLGFLASSPMQSDDPVRFLRALQGLLDMARERSDEDQKTIDARRARGVRWPPKPVGLTDSILNAMRGSSNAILALYGAAEEPLPLHHSHWSAQ